MVERQQLDDFLRSIGIPEPAGIINALTRADHRRADRDKLWLFELRTLTTAQRVEDLREPMRSTRRWDYKRDDTLGARCRAGPCIRAGSPRSRRRRIASRSRRRIRTAARVDHDIQRCRPPRGARLGRDGSTTLSPEASDRH
jgi:hypothetical protein